MAGILRGPKFSGKHSTFIKEAKPFLKFAKDCEYVKKIVLGDIVAGVNSSHDEVIKEREFSLECIIKAGRQLQVFYLHTTDKSAVIAAFDKWKASL